MTTSVSVILSEANGSRAGIMEFSCETLRDPSALLKQHSFGELKFSSSQPTLISRRRDDTKLQTK